MRRLTYLSGVLVATGVVGALVLTVAGNTPKPPEGPENAGGAAAEVPVDVVVYLGDNDSTPLSEASIRAAIDDPRSTSSATHIWAPTGIAFRTANITYQRQDAGLEKELITFEESIDPCAPTTRHAKAAPQPPDSSMLHIRVGGELRAQGGVRSAAAGSCGAFDACRTGFTDTDVILANEVVFREDPHVIAHELGHLLGIHHSDAPRPCGQPLDGPPADGFAADSRNLMIGAAVTAQPPFALSDAQVARAWELVCTESLWVRAAGPC